jgi:hypothetical protein
MLLQPRKMTAGAVVFHPPTIFAAAQISDRICQTIAPLFARA